MWSLAVVVVLLACSTFGQSTAASAKLQGSGPQVELPATLAPSRAISLPTPLESAPPSVTAAPASVNDSALRWVAGPADGPTPTIDPAYASDPATGLAVVFGGYQNTTPPCPVSTTCASAQTWVLSRGVWTNVTPATPTSTNTPSARFGAMMAWDPELSEFVLFGGASAMPNGLNNPALGDTWLFDPSEENWVQTCLTCLAGTSSPTARWDGGMAFDEVNGTVVEFGGLTTTSGAQSDLADTWTFNGTAWSKVTVGGSPAARASPAMAWDGQSGSIVLEGGVPAGGPTDHTWSFGAAGWTELSPTDSPTEMGGSAAVTDPVNGSVTVYGGCTSDPCTTGAINQTWSFTDGDWYHLVPTAKPAPAGRDHAALFDLGISGGIAMFGGDVKAAPANDTWYLFHLQVGQVDAAPGTVDIGQTVSLNVNVTGGAGYDSFRWTGLPNGCASANLSTIRCTATGPGPYTSSIRAIVMDQLLQVVDAPAVTVQINADPSVSIQANPVNGIVPLQVTFLATATGGTSPIVFSWRFGDGSSGLGPNPSHTYTRPGNFSATVWANDSLGLSSRQTMAIDAVALLGVNLAVSPATVQVGNATEIAATGFGGVAPYSYDFAGLPTGCTATSANISMCTVPTAGTYRFSVTVTDHSGQSASSNGTLQVVVRPGSPNKSSAVPTVDWYLLGAGIAAGLVLGLVGLAAYRRRRQAPGGRPSTTVPVPEPHEVPPTGGSLYVPPPGKDPRRKP